MAEGPERRPLKSIFRIIDDTLEELSLPGPFDIFPTPSEIFHAFELPTLNDAGEGLKAKATAAIERKKRKGARR